MKKTIIIILSLFIYLNGFSQVTDVKISKNTTIINNQKFYLHKVEKGQTFYSICKAYGVSQKDVAKTNNLYSPSDIKFDDIIKIPVVKKEEQNSPDYTYHKVEKGETLYALSKKYNVSLEDIIKHNPDAKYGLKTEQIIKIPNIKKGNFDYENKDVYYYTVEKRNTLFSISQKFKIPIKQIIIFNPTTKDGLKTGQVLKIPKTNYDISERLPVTNKDSIITPSYDNLYFTDEGITPCSDFSYDKTQSFNIVLLLPLFLDDNLSKMSRYKNEKDKMFYRNTKNFVEIYEGVLLALQKLKSQGLSIKLTVYDTKKDAKTVKHIMDNLNYPNVDLLIGPIYSKNIKIVAQYSKRHHINLVSPLSQNNALIANNPFIYQVVPSNTMRIKKTADTFAKLHNTNFLIIHNGTEKEKKLIDVYKEKLSKSTCFQENTNAISLKTVDYSVGGVERVEDALSVGIENIVIIPSNEEVFITQTINQLDTLTKRYNIKLVGSPKWEHFQSINLKNLKSLSFQYLSPTFINYYDSNVNKFIKQYRETYRTEPSTYSFEGYDIMYYFASALRKYGRHFQFCLSPNVAMPNRHGLIFDFDFMRTNENGGFENNGTFLLEYDENFRLQEVKKQ